MSDCDDAHYEEKDDEKNSVTQCIPPLSLIGTYSRYLSYTQMRVYDTGIVSEKTVMNSREICRKLNDLAQPCIGWAVADDASIDLCCSIYHKINIFGDRITVYQDCCSHFIRMCGVEDFTLEPEDNDEGP